ncbi:NADP-dependent oxidoreductase domain-containing protein 1 [Ornithorhynchus anatinus]|uniref:NADP-dependent oxidoreductase domain-containing protein 1 n=1 Tax=Ornithorhynchus anatinus TaxID=9258 RepID=F7B0H9_ORNAN|nr:NADP-dependent oxidoreductase domain-containing protein 1 [Ornithorhynchus anatinus]
MEENILENLQSLQFEQGVGEEERPLLFLLGRFRGLMLQACAHAVFFCKLLRALRQTPGNGPVSLLPSPGACSKEKPLKEPLKVGIIGGGHLGKQLAKALLQVACIPSWSLQVSTRRPDTLGDLQDLGVVCFYDNCQLVDWADVVFLCCLPSQLSHICFEIHSRLRESSIVYSLVTAVSLSRLKQLLSHTTILRPQYQCSGKCVNVWGGKKKITAALQDPAIIKATCPFSPEGGITIDIKWLEAVFYAALNTCTSQGMPHPQALELLSNLCLPELLLPCQENKINCPPFQVTHFVNKSFAQSMTSEDTFPWFNLTMVQLKETPFSQYLTACAALRDQLATLYCNSFGLSLPESEEDQSASSSG